MLIKYEFEILSYMADKSIKKTNSILHVPFSIVENLDENIEIILSKLETLNIIHKKKSGIEIDVNSWMNKFSELLRIEFKKNRMDIECSINQENKEIVFNMNGTNKHIKMKFDKNDYEYEDIIFMIPEAFNYGVYWIDLLNDVNTLHLFYSYLVNEINMINKYEYKQIDIFDGIEGTHVSEIFNVSIKSYLKNKYSYIYDPNKDIVKMARKLLKKDEVNSYMVEINGYQLLIIKDNKIIKFLTFEYDNLVYVREIDDIIVDIREKLIKKVSAYRKLVMFRDNKIIDNSVKIANSASKLLLPTSVITSILSLSSLIDIDRIKHYDKLILIIIIVLVIIQGWIVSFIYIPSYKLGKFKWDID